MRQLRLPGRFLRHFVCKRCAAIPRGDSIFRSPPRGYRRADARVLFDRCHPLPSGICPKDAFGSPKFPANPSCIRPALRLRPGLHARHLNGASVLPPHITKSRTPEISLLTQLNHTAFALAVYASCRPHGRRRKTRFRWSAKPCRVGFLIPTEFVRRVSTVASPLPGLILARRNRNRLCLVPVVEPVIGIALDQGDIRAAAFRPQNVQRRRTFQS